MRRKREAVSDAARLEKRYLSGANWFFWIAGLSLLNSLLLMTGCDWLFIVGMALNRIVDGIALAFADQIGPSVKFAAIGIDIIIAGTVCLFGCLARDNRKWAFAAGILFYSLDGLLLLLVNEYTCVGFHAAALFFLFNGLYALQRHSTKRYPHGAPGRARFQHAPWPEQAA